MLVLTRKIGERILIGDQICVTVVRISPNAVRLGIQAASDLDIVREELVGTSGKIQASEADIEDIGRRVIDPLGVAEAYE